MYSIIRCPRHYISKRNHRYLGVKVGDIVWYYWHDKKRPKMAGWNEYKVVELEDHFYDRKRDPSDPKQKQSCYCRYAWLKRIKRAGPSPTSSDITPNVMKYNNKIWTSGNIGHGVNYDEYYHSLGEALASTMRTGLRDNLHITGYKPTGKIGYHDPTHDSCHIKDYVPDYDYIERLKARKPRYVKHVKDFTEITNTYITHGRPSRHIKDYANYRDYLEGKSYYVSGKLCS